MNSGRFNLTINKNSYWPVILNIYLCRDIFNKCFISFTVCCLFFNVFSSISYDTNGKVLHYGSHNAPRLGLFATKTMLEEMSRDNFAGFKKISEIGDQITKRLNQAAADTGQNMRVQNVGSMFHPVFTDLEDITNYRDFCQTVNLAKYADFSQKMRDQGIFFSGNKILHNLSCTEHTQADIDASIAAAGNALEQMAHERKFYND